MIPLAAVSLLVGLLLWDVEVSALSDIPPSRDTAPSGELHRDAVYMGSMTFAGLALFGSIMLLRAFDINKYDSLKQKGGAMAVVVGTLVMVVLHVTFAFGYFEFPPSIVALFTVGLVVVIVVGAGLVAPNSKEQSK